MKKLCLLMVILTTLSSLPSMAMKEIINDQNDRIVYSRSSRPDNTYLYNDNDYIPGKIGTINYTPAERHAAAHYTLTPISYGQLKELGDNIKVELIGTTWEYNYNEYKTDKNITYDKGKTPSHYYPQRNYIASNQSSHNCREAADYYSRDNQNPNELVPCGFEADY